MDVPHGFDPTLILVLNLAGTFSFGLSGGLAAVRARLDLFGIVVLTGVVALAGGIIRDLLIGVPPATFRDWRYLAAAGAAGLVCFFARPALERIKRSVLVFDAVGLGLFCVTGATKALDFGVGAVPAILLGAITGVGGGILRDVLLRDVRPSCATTSTPSRRSWAPACSSLPRRAGRAAPCSPCWPSPCASACGSPG